MCLVAFSQLSMNEYDDDDDDVIRPRHSYY